MNNSNLDSDEDIDFRNCASPTAAKAFVLEEAILGASAPPTVTDLARRLGIAQSLVSRILKTMESLDLIRRDPNSRGWLPSGRLEERNRFAAHPLSLTHRARNAMEWLVAEANETAQLLIESRGKMLVLDQWLCDQPMQVVGKVGATVPVHSCAPGKVWLAFCEDASREEWYRNHRLKSYTPNTISDRSSMDAHLVEIRRRGWAFDDEEGIPNLWCVAAPVRNHRRHLEGAITVMAPKDRIDSERAEELARLVVESTRQVL